MQLRSLCGLLVLTLTGGAYAMLPVAPSHAAEWLAPAADERITADWVRDVAQELRKNRFKNVFMNQPFGCDQCRILHYLNNAAAALDNDQPTLAKSFVKEALRVLRDGREDGWYTSADIRPINRLIIRKADKAFKDAGAKLAFSIPEKRRDARYEQGDSPLFSRSAEDEAYGERTNRWPAYGKDDARDVRQGRIEASSDPSERRQKKTFKRTVQKAIDHAQRANEAGKKGNPDEFMQQSKKALNFAKEAQRAGQNERLNEGVYALGEAIEHGKKQETKDAREHVMHAIMKLSQSADLHVPDNAIPPASSEHAS